ncbi:hypothetical protein M405DRAFT_767627 [Rhizopogon salebrosus TDB-379]|nr:hypothetical protein M405DRAFT_767627 [Rhizopogon salebrosus TDB-379]
MDANVSYYMPFSTSQTRGLVVVPVFALLSALALSFIVYRCIRFVVIPSFRRNAPTPTAPENLFFRTHLGHYAASLVFSNVVLTSAGLMEFFWVKHSGIRHGHLCNAQAALMQTGSWATCFFSLAIGLHTCISLVFRLRHIRWMSVAVIAFGWIISLVIGLGPLCKKNVYGPNIVSCGVTITHPGRIFGLKSFPVLLGSVLAVIIYSLIFLVLRGVLRVQGGIKFTFKPQERWSAVNNSEEYDRFMGAIANSMFWYPIAFVLLLLPFTIGNLIQFRGQNISFGFDVFVHACWSILGLVNVALLYNTFRVLSPVFHGLKLPKIQIDVEKSFGNNATDESPILPPAASKSKGPLLPLYRKDTSQAVSPLSLSEFPEVKQHSRNSSNASTDSTTHLLSIKRKPSRYHSMRVKQDKMQSLAQIILPAAELNRRLGTSDTSDTANAKSHSLYLDLPVVEVSTAKPTLETVSLSPAPRSAVASMLSPSSIVLTPPKSAGISPMRQITLAFGRPRRKSKFGPRSKDSATLPQPPLSPIPSVESPTNMSAANAAIFRVSSANFTEGQRPPQLDLTPIVPVRPLPVITAEIETVQKVDKGKGRARTPPLQVLMQKDIISLSRNVIRPLPEFPRNSTGSLSSDDSNHPDSNVLLLSVSSFLSLSSPQPSFNSAYSSNASVEGARGKALPIPQTCGNTSEEEDSTDSEHSPSLSIDTKGQDLPSKRTTQATFWSQDSAVTPSQVPDMAAALAQLLARARS